MHIHSNNFVGGQQNDLYCSTNDPIFYAIHTPLDGICSVCQAQDYESRLYAMNGTVTDVMHTGVEAGDSPIGNAMGTGSGTYRYICLDGAGVVGGGNGGKEPSGMLHVSW